MRENRQRLRWLAGSILLLGLVALPILYLASRTVDFDIHYRNLVQLRRMQALDAVLDQSIIAVRYGLLDSYDPIVRSLQALDGAEQNLSLDAYRLTDTERLRLADLRAAVRARIGEKADAVENLKSMNSALRNSLAYLPVVAAEVIQLGRAGGLNEAQLEDVRQLLEAVLLLSLDMGESQAGRIGGRVASLREVRAGLPAEGPTAPLARALDGVISHASVVFRSDGAVGRLVSTILAKPVRPTLDQLDTELNEAYNRLAAQAELYRNCLAILAALLVAAAGIVLWRLWATAKRLDVAVRELEFQKFALDQHAIVAMYDAEARLIYANPSFAAMAGQPAARLLGRPFDAVLAPHEARSRIDTVLATVLRGQVWHGVLKCGTGAGGVYFADTTIVPFSEPSGSVFRFAFIQNDVSELKRIEAQLVEARDRALAAGRAKSAFLANMSHELRTPLNAITGYSELLLEDTPGRDPALQRDLGRIRDAGKQLLALVNDVLELSRIEAGRAELALSSVDVGSLVREAAQAMQPAVEANGNQLEVALDTGPRIVTDPGKVRQILEHLLSNAGKFTRRGQITLRVRATAHRQTWDGVVVEVGDTGMGMTADGIARAFEPFAGTDAAVQRGVGSTGLGLAITRRLVELLEGRIEVVSAPQQGTTVRLYLPAAIGGKAMPATAPATGQRTAILIIDDDPELHATVGGQLAAEGLEVASALSGQAGLELAGSRRFDAILLDVVMPGMDGWAVLRRLKSDPSLARTPVIMLTIMEHAELGLALGAAAYLRKPADPGRLVVELRQHAHAAPGDVLVVDDDARTREMLARIFKRQGVPVVEAADGAAALAYLEGHPPPGVIILDLAMPGTDGFLVVDRLSADDRWRAIPVIVLTAKDLTAREIAALTGHVRRIFQKGRFERSELLAAVREQLDRRAAG